MCGDDGRVEDDGESTTSRMEQGFAHVFIGAEETMVNDDRKSASDPSHLPPFDWESPGGCRISGPRRRKAADKGQTLKDDFYHPVSLSVVLNLYDS